MNIEKLIASRNIGKKKKTLTQDQRAQLEIERLKRSSACEAHKIDYTDRESILLSRELFNRFHEVAMAMDNF